VQIFQGKYIVRASVQVEGVTRATGLAAAETVEAAEDQARTRALLVLGIANAPQESVALSSTPISETQIKPTSSTNSSGQDKDFLSSQWSVVSGKEISPPPLNERNIKPEPITTDYVNAPAVSQKLELTTDKGNVNTSDTYSQDLGKEFRVANREIPFDTPVETLEIISGNQAENQPLLGISASNVTPFTPRNYNPQEDAAVPTSTGRKKKKSEPVDLSDVIAKTDVELQRLGWTPEQGREHLIKTYGKRGRTLLTEDELHGFLQYLQSQPDPIAGF
jgi:hypothetical protein